MGVSVCSIVETLLCTYNTSAISGTCLDTESRDVLTDILRALLHAPKKFSSVMRRAIEYLANNAQRAHPKRDKQKGRLKLGLEHVYVSP